MNRIAIVLLALGAAGIATTAAAQLPTREAPAVPPALEDWRGWVLHDDKDLYCASLGDGRACSWPGLLAIAVEPTRATFALEVWLDRPGRVPLPGDAQLLPQQVRAGELPALVVRDDQGLPAVMLQAGHSKVSGELTWHQPPETLTVPPAIGAVALRVGEADVARPRREGDKLWLGQQERDNADEGDSLQVRIFRRIDDGVPLKIHTRLEVQAAGRARDVAMGTLLPAGAIPIGLDGGGLPAVIGSDGALRLHVRPGSFVVGIDAVLPQDAAAIPVPAHASGTGIDDVEAWAFFPDAALRTVELAGLPAVDPARAGLPDDWRGGSSLLASPGERLALHTTRRGQVEAPPDRLSLRRELWLDLDGGGWTAQDSLKGELHREFRVDFADGDGAILGRVHDAGRGRDALITVRPDAAGVRGVELRQGNVDLRAESRLATAARAMAAVGWQLDPIELHAQLRLPPGWRLLGAEGVDSAPGTWVDSWKLLDFFLVLMVAGATLRLFGWGAGALALVTMFLCHDEPDAPAWLWLHLLAATALARVLPVGWARRLAEGWRALAGLALLVLLVPFALDQVRAGIYPQVGARSHFGNAFTDFAFRGGGDDEAKGALPTAAPALEAQAQVEEAAAAAEGSVVQHADNMGMLGSGSGGGGEADGEGSLGRRKNAYVIQKKALKAQQMRNLVEVDPKAVVQTGLGVPDWSWSRWNLHWSGPVRRDHRIELWLLSPTLGLWLGLAKVALIVALAFVILQLRQLGPALRGWVARSTGVFGGGAGGGGAASTPMWLLAALGAASLLAVPAPALASEPGPAAARPPSAWPPQELLEALRTRLQEAESCQGPCTTTPAATLSVQPDGAATLRAEVHAVRPAGWALPRGLAVAAVSIDGAATLALRRDDDGVVWARVPAGRHLVEARGSLGGGAALQVAFVSACKPARLQVDAAAWRVDGVNPDGWPEDSVQLSRIQAEPGASAAPDEVAGLDLPDWFSVERRLQLGLPWHTETVLRRLRGGRPALVKLPLLAGEAVLSDGVRVEQVEGGRVALVAFERDQTEVSVQGQIDIAPSIVLRAASGVAFTETWLLECSPIWRCRTEGMAPVATEDETKALRPLFRPWPGEAVTIHVERPAAADGQAVTVDAAVLEVHPGQRLLEATLTLSLRASQGGTRTLGLPADAALQSVTIGGQARPLSLANGALTLPYEPGASEVRVAWQQPWQRAMHEQVPAVDVGGPAVNLRTVLHLGEQRWLLWASGPAWGPAVLFWSHLLVLVLLAAILSRLRGLPLRGGQWLLLCLGFANLPVATLLLLVAWLVALSFRRRHFAAGAGHDGLFVLTQLALVCLTLVALGALYAAIHANLLLDIDMQVAGNGSSNDTLRWYADRTAGPLPTPAMWSLPLWTFRVAMLLWSLWLVTALLGWLRWAWACFGDGGLWRSAPAPAAAAASTVTATPAAEPATAASAAEAPIAPSGPPRDDLPPPPAT